MSAQTTDDQQTSAGGSTPPGELAPAAEGSTWVVLLWNAIPEDQGGHGWWVERQERLSGLNRRDAEKAALALAAAEQGVVVVPASSWKPKVAEPPREPRIADFDPWEASS